MMCRGWHMRLWKNADMHTPVTSLQLTCGFLIFNHSGKYMMCYGLSQIYSATQSYDAGTEFLAKLGNSGKQLSHAERDLMRQASKDTNFKAPHTYIRLPIINKTIWNKRRRRSSNKKKGFEGLPPETVDWPILNPTAIIQGLLNADMQAWL